MAFSTGLHINVQTDGHDTNCGGGFDPGLSGITWSTDLAATSATGNSPVVTSASYTFVAADVGAWVYIASGTNWLTGWYEIASVNAGAATLKAAVGEAIVADARNGGLNRTAGCATVASPTSGSWSVDYSKQASAEWSYTDLAIDGSTNTDITSATYPFGVNHVGNVISVTAGTNFTVQRVGIVSIQSGAKARCDKAVGTAGATGGTGYLGGAMASPGGAGGWHTGGTRIHIKAGTYQVTTTSTNVANGILHTSAGNTTYWTMVVGYTTRPYDRGGRPLIQGSGLSASANGLIQVNGSYCLIQHIAFDCASLSSLSAVFLQVGSRVVVEDCSAVNIVWAGFSMQGASTGYVIRCHVSGTAGNGVDSCAGVFETVVEGCATGFYKCWVCADCIADDPSGDGFNSYAVSLYYHCSAYSAGDAGFDLDQTSICESCISEGSAGYGYKGAANKIIILRNCASYNNASGRATLMTADDGAGTALELSGSPFTDAANDDFSLNNTAGAGAVCRGAGYPGVFPFADRFSTTGYRDIGAVQHADPAGGSGGAVVAMPSSLIGAGVL